MLNKTLTFCDGDADAGVTAIARTIRSNSRAKNCRRSYLKMVTLQNKNIGKADGCSPNRALSNDDIHWKAGILKIKNLGKGDYSQYTQNTDNVRRESKKGINSKSTKLELWFLHTALPLIAL